MRLAKWVIINRRANPRGKVLFTKFADKLHSLRVTIDIFVNGGWGGITIDAVCFDVGCTWKLGHCVGALVVFDLKMMRILVSHLQVFTLLLNPLLHLLSELLHMS